MIKGTGFLLALVPPIAIIAGRRWYLLKSWKLWLSAVVVVVICGPWTVLTMKMVQDGWEQSAPSWGFTRTAVPFYLWKLILSASPIVIDKTTDGNATGPHTFEQLAVSVAVFGCDVPCLQVD